MKSIGTLVKALDWVAIEGGRDWRDGLLLGNGNLAAVAYAPGHLEYVINKVDVFDPTQEEDLLEKIIPHNEFLRRIKDMTPKNTYFLNELENAPLKRKRHRDTLSCAIMRLSSWYGIGWSAPPVPVTKRRLSLYDAILEEEMDSHNLHLKVKMFIPRGKEVIAMHLSGTSGNGVLPHILELVRPCDDRLKAPLWHTEKENMLGFTQALPGNKSYYTIAALFVPCEGQKKSISSANDRCGVLEQTGETYLYITVKTHKNAKKSYEEAIKELEEASGISFEKLEEGHKNWWHSYWEKGAYADFGKYKELQKYYTFSLYELACVYGKAPMPGLNGMAYGPLTERVPGVGCQGYAHDQNVQISALGTIPANRVELITAFADTYLNAAKELKRNTRKTFGCDGIYIPLSTNQLGKETPTKSYRYTICGSAYTGMVLCYAWKYSQDVLLLKEKLYPLLREFVLFYSSIMRKGEDGKYHLDWSVPPEIFTLTRDELSTIALFKLCLETTIEAAKILKRDKKYLPQWKELLANYPSMPRRPDGAYWGGPDLPLNHFFYGGHTIYPFFPAAIENDVDAAQKTLKFIEEEAVERTFADFDDHFHMNHDWSEFITTATNLRAGNREKGWKKVHRFLELFAKENGLFSHDPILIGPVKASEENEKRNEWRMYRDQINPDGGKLDKNDPNISHVSCVTENPDAKRLAPAVIEGNSAIVFLASELLLQSAFGIIKLFPGVPEDFTGEYTSFLAEGGFEIASQMEEGKIVYVKIYSRTGGKFILANLNNKEITMKAGETLEITENLERIM